MTDDVGETRQSQPGGCEHLSALYVHLQAGRYLLFPATESEQHQPGKQGHSHCRMLSHAKLCYSKVGQ